MENVLKAQSGARVAQWVRSLDLTAHTSLSPIRRGFAPSFVDHKKGCTRLAAASDKVYQLLAQGRWFSPGTPAFSTTKTGRHDITEILLKVVLKRQKSTKKKSKGAMKFGVWLYCCILLFVVFRSKIRLWNELPTAVVTASTLEGFKDSLQTVAIY